MEQNIQLIRKVMTMPINHIKVIESGFHSVAYIVNHQFVFRFPRLEDFYQEYKNEYVILNCLSPHVDVSIPKLKIHQFENVLFTEHAYIKGFQYSQLSMPLNETNKDILANDLAMFLKQLHEVSLPEIPYLPTEHQFNEAMVQKCSVLTTEEKRKCLHLLNCFQECFLSEKDVVLCHTDLNENNFLLDNNKLVGVIDFGNACRRNFSTEFSTLLKYDYDLVMRIAKHYQALTGRKIDMAYALLFQKIRCFDGIIENATHIDNVNRYRRWLNKIELHEAEIKERFSIL